MKIVRSVNKGIPVHSTVVLRDKGIPHDCVEPCLQISTFFELFFVRDRLQHAHRENKCQWSDV